MATVYIGIGSNRGDRKKNIETAVKFLGGIPSIVITKQSAFYETDPSGGPPQEKYLNGVLEIMTDRTPTDLLDRLQSIEDRLGRVRAEQNGPRTIDLDILLYDTIRMRGKRLVIPHPRMHEREFVMRGLREIAPDVAETVVNRNSAAENR